jgi:hypothetical protein
MARLRRRWHVLKWGGLGLTLLILLAWAGSFVWFFRHRVEFRRSEPAGSSTLYHSFRFSISDGELYFQYQPLRLYESHLPCGLHRRDTKWTGRVRVKEWLPRLERYPNNIGWDVRLPLWIPLVIVAVPTRFLWRHGRTRAPRQLRLLVRACLAFPIVILVAWAVSLPWSWRYDECVSFRPPPQIGAAYGVNFPVFSVYLHAGCLHLAQFGRPPMASPVITWQWHVDRHLRPPRWLPGPRRAGNWVIPLWILFLIAALPPSLLWLLDRRIPPHCCQHCGYDLTGNTSGVCPECGLKTNG